MTVTKEDRNMWWGDVIVIVQIRTRERESVLSAVDHNFHWIWLLFGRMAYWLARGNGICRRIRSLWFVWNCPARIIQHGVDGREGVGCAQHQIAHLIRMLAKMLTSLGDPWSFLWTIFLLSLDVSMNPTHHSIVPMDSFQLLLSYAQVIFTAHTWFFIRKPNGKKMG